MTTFEVETFGRYCKKMLFTIHKVLTELSFDNKVIKAQWNATCKISDL
jgi:hypothetical protein